MANAPVVVDKERNIEWQPNELDNFLFGLPNTNTVRGAGIFGVMGFISAEVIANFTDVLAGQPPRLHPEIDTALGGFYTLAGASMGYFRDQYEVTTEHLRQERANRYSSTKDLEP